MLVEASKSYRCHVLLVQIRMFIMIAHWQSLKLYVVYRNYVEVVNAVVLWFFFIFWVDPPNQPEISGHRQSVRAGDLERMTCLSVGGNPVAELKWYKGKLAYIYIYMQLHAYTERNRDPA